MRLPLHLFVCFEESKENSEADNQEKAADDDKETEFIKGEENLESDKAGPSTVPNNESGEEFLRSALVYKSDRCSPTLVKDVSIPDEFRNSGKWMNYFILTGEGIERGKS